MPLLNIAAYRFVSIEQPAALRPLLRGLCERLALRGTILLAPEGINLFLAGEAAKVEQFLAELCADARFAGLEAKRSWSETQPFGRLRVKLKREIITLRRHDIDPARRPARRLAPAQLKAWLDAGRELLLLDTRNGFEVAAGTFEGARNLNLRSFTDFPSAVGTIDEAWKDRPVVAFCTGGIRCEKAAPLLESEGFREVYQLDGGILKYFEQCGGAHYRGECFVFDERVALKPDLKPVAPQQTLP